MSTHTVKLVKREHVAEGTMAFHLERPAGFAYKPGQAIDVTLIETPGGLAGNERHAFSIVSAPFEEEIVVATRMRESAYKRALGALAVGAVVQIKGPFGALTLHADRARPAVLVAGGIGITPFMSMLRQARRDDWPQQIVLVYANRSPEAAAYLDELERLARSRGAFRLLTTMTAADVSPHAWRGARRPIDGDLLRAASDGLVRPVYYVAGPPGMVEAVAEALRRASVSEEDVRSETFYGY
jgi:ferredoxin-NADP reductase